METIKKLKTEELQHGIDRCKARLSGVIPMGILNKEMVKEALLEYKKELQRRNVIIIDF